MRKALASVAVVLVAVTLPPAAQPAPTGALERATKLLRGARFTRFVDTGSIAVSSSLDQRLHLCSNGRFILDQVSNIPDAGEPRITRTLGTWRVVAASFGRTGTLARVRGIPQQGRPVMIVIARTARGVTVDGSPVSVGRSDLCR
jgi:hypothetical protein